MLLPDNRRKAAWQVLQRRKTDVTMTCIPLAFLCGDFFSHLFSHGSRAAAATSPRSPQEDIRRGEEKGETSEEETMTSPSHPGSQCSTNIGAPQHDHYHHYDQCTSCEDSSEDGDILATCLHLYDIDIKDGACYMLNLPQPRLPTPTVFDGTSPTFPEWARELRAYLSISQFEYINLFAFAYDAEAPLTTDIMVLQAAAGARQNAEILRHRARIQALQAERDLPQGDRREHAIIDGDIQQANNDIAAQQLLQDATTTAARRAGELFGYLIMHATKPGTEPNNLIRRLQRTNIGWEMFRQLRHQHAAGACTTIRLTTRHSTSSASMDRDITTTTTISEMDSRHLSIRDDTSRHQRCVESEYSNKQLTWTDTTTSVASCTTTSYSARSTSNDRQLLCQQLHALTWSDHREHRPGHQHRAEEGERQVQHTKRKRKERKREGLEQQLLQLQLQSLQHLPQPVTTTSERKVKR